MDKKKLNNFMPKDPSEKVIEVRETELDGNLKNAAKGTGIIFFGQIVGMILGLFTTMLVARFYSTGDYGLLSLGILIISFFLSVSSLGLSDGCMRFISYYRGKADNARIKGTIISSLGIITISSTIAAIILFFLSDFIANRIFHIEALSIVIKIIVIGLPFWVIIDLIVSIFRGFESVKENVYFSLILLRLFKIPIFAFVIFLGLSINYIIVGYVLSIIITSFAAMFYLFKKMPEQIKKIKGSQPETKMLLSFSLPLVFSGLGWYLITGADNFMLGIMKTEVEIGLYNAATPLVNYLTFFLRTAVFIFMPIAARLLAENKLYDLKKIYQILTKWLFTMAFPLILLFMLFPEAVISIIYGEKYISASIALQLLTIGAFVNLILGPNGDTIIVFGKTKVLMYITLIGGCFNVVLNFFLIPSFGIDGAALATMISLIVMNIFNSLYLYHISKIYPFQKNFTIPVILSVTLLAVYFIIDFHLVDFPYIFKILYFLLSIILYFLSILLTKSYDEDELQLMFLVEKRIGYRFNFLRKIIQKFE